MPARGDLEAIDDLGDESVAGLRPGARPR